MAREPEAVIDLPAIVEHSCLAVCRKMGRVYTSNVREDLITAVAASRDPRGQLLQTRLLAQVETLLDQLDLPLGRRGGS